MTTEAPSSTSAERYLEVQNSAEFAGLRKSLRSFVFPMTAAFFLWYALYVLLSAYARGFMGIKLIGHINVALVLGLLQFVSTFAIAWLYSRYADKNFDPTADKIRADLDGAAALKDSAALAESAGSTAPAESPAVSTDSTTAGAPTKTDVKTSKTDEKAAKTDEETAK